MSVTVEGAVGGGVGCLAIIAYVVLGAFGWLAGLWVGIKALEWLGWL